MKTSERTQLVSLHRANGMHILWVMSGAEAILRQEERADIIAQLWEVFRERRSPFVVVGSYKIEVNVEDFLGDLHEFLRQATYRLAHRMLWPCVIANRVDLVDGVPTPRFIPLNLENISYDEESDRELLERRFREEGVQISVRPITQASDGFFSGVTDSIIGRAKSIILGTIRNPEVEVITNPTGVRVLFSKGHFFSTSRVFGHSDCKNQVVSQTYCFYKASDTPNYQMDLWDITGDIKIPL